MSSAPATPASRGERDGQECQSGLQWIVAADTLQVPGREEEEAHQLRGWWATHNVRFHVNGIKHFHHPVVGELHLNFERLDLAADTGLTLFTYTAEPGSRDEEALQPPR